MLPGNLLRCRVGSSNPAVPFSQQIDRPDDGKMFDLPNTLHLFILAPTQSGPNQVMNKIEGCEVCGASQLLPVLDLGQHPMCDDLVPVGNGRVPVDYPISIVFCPICRTAHQEYQIP